MKCLCAERWGIGRIKKDREGAEFLPLTARCFSTKSGQGVISSKSHFLSSHFSFLGSLITKGAPIFALFDLVAASQVQRCCQGAAAGVLPAARRDASPCSLSSWQPMPSACAKCVAFTSLGRNLKFVGFFFSCEKRILLALGKRTMWVLSTGVEKKKKKEQIKKKKGERRKEGNNQSFQSTHWALILVFPFLQAGTRTVSVFLGFFLGHSGSLTEQ